MNSTVEALVAIAATLSALGVIGYTVRRVAKSFRKFMRRVRTLGDLIERELLPNHGSSMKDTVNAIQGSLSDSQLDRADLHRRVDAIVRRLRRLHPEVDWRAADRGDEWRPPDE